MHPQNGDLRVLQLCTAKDSLYKVSTRELLISTWPNTRIDTTAILTLDYENN
jgi:hypothetical protein